MKLPSSLTKGLKDEQIQELENQLKSSRLAKQLRAWLEAEIVRCEIREEEVDFSVATQLAKQVGERRGYRRVLNLLPEE